MLLNLLLLVLLTGAVAASLLPKFIADRRTGATARQENTELNIPLHDIQEEARRIARRHEADLCLTVRLTSGVMRGPGSAELHTRQPADPVHLRCAFVAGKPHFDVYSGGYKIGAIDGPAADELNATLGTNRVTGAYVCEQNCYDDYSRTDLKLLVFHSGDCPASHAAYANRGWTRIDADHTLRHIVVCQN